MSYQLQNDLMEVDFNFSSMAAIVSPSPTSLKIVAHFRAISDYIGLSYNSKDFRMHDQARYDENTDFTGVKLSFKPAFSGHVTKFNDTKQLPSIDINYLDKTRKAVTLGFLSNTTRGSTSIEGWSGEADLGFKWIKWDSETVDWGADVVIGYEDIFDSDGMYVTTIEIKEWQEGTGARGSDYAIDYVMGTIAPVSGGSIPHEAGLDISLEYGLHETYTIDFDTVVQGTHPDNAVETSSTNIEKMVIPIIPDYYVEGENILTGRSDLSIIDFTDWKVTGSADVTPIPPQEEHPYRVAEGYDDEYYRNPKRLVESMHHLGYRKIINLYIGASHYYDKAGVAGQDSTISTSQFLIKDAGVCEATRVWLKYYCIAMKAKGFTELVMSVSMENLQMPSDWRQKMFNGEDGQTGWEPPTSFFSPTNTEVRDYFERICRTLLDVMVAEGMPPILQLGEPWWWWQEFIPGDIHTPYPGKPPCFYDGATRQKFKAEKGRELPMFESNQIEINPSNMEALLWLRDQLGDFSNAAKQIVKSYSGGIYTVLFFPPSVLDEERVTEGVRTVNVPKAAWEFPQLDYIQIEDYDWVIHQNARHPEIFDFAEDYFGYQPFNSHYFSGFAWKEYTTSTGLSIEEQWELIEHAGVSALSKGISDVFIWAGTQIRRDSWLPEMPIRYRPNIVNRENLNVVEPKDD